MYFYHPQIQLFPEKHPLPTTQVCVCAHICVCALVILQDQFVLSIIFWNMVDVVGTILRENSLSLF